MYLRTGILTVLLVFSVTTVVQSQPTTDKRRKEQTEYETALQNLKQDNPKEYQNTRQLMILMTQLLLGRLGYGVGPYDGVLNETTKDALREYQKRRKLTVTGDPTSFETFQQVEKDMKSLDNDPVGLPSLFVSLDFWKAGYVSGKGTWILANEKMGWPEQTTQLECRRDQRICTEATAILSRTGGSKSLSVQTSVYEIERWDDHEIVTKPKESGFGCVRYTLRINRVQKSVTGIRITISTKGPCESMVAKEMYMTLSDGLKVYLDLYRNSKKTMSELMRYSPEMLRSMEQSRSK